MQESLKITIIFNNLNVSVVSQLVPLSLAFLTKRIIIRNTTAINRMNNKRITVVVLAVITVDDDEDWEAAPANDTLQRSFSSPNCKF